MMFDKVRTLLKAKQPKTADLRGALAEVQKAHDAAVAERDGLATAHRTAILSSDKDYNAHRAIAADVDERIAAAAVFIDELGKRLQQRSEAELDGERRRLYDEAQAAAAAIAKTLEPDYAALVASAHDFLERLAGAQSLVVRANAALPAGAVPLVDPEAQVRRTPEMPKKILKEEKVELWVQIGSPYPLSPEFQKTATNDGAHIRQWFIRRQVQQPVYATHPLSFAGSIELPSLHESGAPGWTQRGLAFDRSNYSPDAELTRIAAARAAFAVPIDPPQPQVVHEYEMISRKEEAA